MKKCMTTALIALSLVGATVAAQAMPAPAKQPTIPGSAMVLQSTYAAAAQGQKTASLLFSFSVPVISTDMYAIDDFVSKEINAPAARRYLEKYNMIVEVAPAKKGGVAAQYAVSSAGAAQYTYTLSCQAAPEGIPYVSECYFQPLSAAKQPLPKA